MYYCMEFFPFPYNSKYPTSKIVWLINDHSTHLVLIPACCHSAAHVHKMINVISGVRLKKNIYYRHTENRWCRVRTVMLYRVVLLMNAAMTVKTRRHRCGGRSQRFNTTIVIALTVVLFSSYCLVLPLLSWILQWGSLVWLKSPLLFWIFLGCFKVSF